MLPVIIIGTPVVLVGLYCLVQYFQVEHRGYGIDYFVWQSPDLWKGQAMYCWKHSQYHLTDEKLQVVDPKEYDQQQQPPPTSNLAFFHFGKFPANGVKPVQDTTLVIVEKKKLLSFDNEQAIANYVLDSFTNR